MENVKITAGKTPQQYQFQVTLVQQQLKRRYSKGYIDLVFEGDNAGKMVKFKLSDVSKIDKKTLKFSFQYFQIISGEFILPEGFSPESVTASAILTKSRWQKYAKKDKQLPWLVSN